MDTRWLFTFEARDPKNPEDDQWKVGLPERLYRKLQINSHDKALARLRLVREVLQGGTTHLYEGWCRP